MKFGILEEANGAHGLSASEIYSNVLKALETAERCGFDRFGMSEQHFWPPLGDIPRLCSMTSPELFYGIAAVNTERIGLRTAITVLPYHHPLMVAERIATLDVISGGRMEFGSGRGNSYMAADALGVKIEESHERWEESLKIIVAAWLADGEFEYEGKYFKIPPRIVYPKPAQKPHPKLFYSALSPQSHELAGRLGLGLMTATAGITLEKLQKRIDLYRSAMKDAEPLGGVTNEFVSLTVLGHCTETEAEAREQAEQAFIDYFTGATLIYQETVTRVNPDVNFDHIKSRYTYDAMQDSCMVISGTPDRWIETITRLQQSGVDEVSINFAGIEPTAARKAMELLGSEVLPKFAGTVSVHA